MDMLGPLKLIDSEVSIIIVEVKQYTVATLRDRNKCPEYRGLEVPIREVSL